jgi:hypothetical protein
LNRRITHAASGFDSAAVGAKWLKKQPGIWKALDRVMEDATAGDPISGLKWSHKSLRKIQQRLPRCYRVSLPTLSRLLRRRSYSLRVNSKRCEGKQSPGRNQQFGYIECCRRRFEKQKCPIISVDSKKKELVGNFRNAGRAWRRRVRGVNVYDFPSEADGKGLPYGIYEITHNEGFVVVGSSHDTPTFAVASIRCWWLARGRKLFPRKKHLLIQADCGGSNGNRCWLWKVGLQAFADEFGLTLIVTHYPTGASKWNRIEHRLFCLISSNWAGIPLDSFETILKHIRTTRSTTGLRCWARLDHREYPTQIKASPEEIAHLRIQYHKTFPQWNYTIYPHRKRR